MNRKTKVILQPVKFRKYDHVAILSLNNPEVDEIIREIDGAEWSTGYRFWHLPLKKDTLDLLKSKLSSMYSIDLSAFKDFKLREDTPETKSKNRRRRNYVLTAPQEKKLLIFQKYLTAKGYGDSSIKVYSSLIKVFFSMIKDRDVDAITSDDINREIDDYISQNSLSLNYKHLFLNVTEKFYTMLRN